MNRVRVVAVTAVVLGVAVVAGTQFQKMQEMDSLGGQQSADASAVLPAPAVTLIETEVAMAANVPASPMPAPVIPASVMPASGPMPEAELATGYDLAAVADADMPDAQVDAPQGLMTASILPVADLLAEPADLSPDAAVPLEDVDPELQAELAACAVWIVVTPSAGAMLDASVYAPCDRGAQVQVSHAGLHFDTNIGTDGQMSLIVPALIDDATVTVTFADGRVHADTTFVPDLATVERVALQWSGPADMLLHAYEFGAQYGDEGHIFAGNPSVPDTVEHGFMTVLGDASITDGQRVQVYSYPSLQSSRSGSVALEIEVPITEASCGKPLAADSIEMHGAAAARSREISLDMPDCDGTGGYVILPGVLQDLQIAALR